MKEQANAIKAVIVKGEKLVSKVRRKLMTEDAAINKYFGYIEGLNDIGVLSDEDKIYFRELFVEEILNIK